MSRRYPGVGGRRGGGSFHGLSGAAPARAAPSGAALRQRAVSRGTGGAMAVSGDDPSGDKLSSYHPLFPSPGGRRRLPAARCWGGKGGGAGSCGFFLPQNVWGAPRGGSPHTPELLPSPEGGGESPRKVGVVLPAAGRRKQNRNFAAGFGLRGEIGKNNTGWGGGGLGNWLNLLKLSS